MERFHRFIRLSATVVTILFVCLFPACSAEDKIDPPRWPEARNMHAAAYLPLTNEMLIFGGTTSAGETNTLWSFKDGQWTFLAENGPQPREDALLIHNTDEGATYLIGGRHNGTGVTYSDMWKWDAGTWSQVPGSLPFAPVTHAAGCYDKANKRLLVFGGIKNKQLSNQIWSWDGTTWSSINTGPSARLAASLVYSAQRQNVYLFGGSLQNGTVQKDVWMLENTTWTKVNDNFPQVMHSAYGVSEYGKNFLVFGGFASTGQSSDTWLFDPEANTWTKLEGTGPGPRALHSITFDPQSNSALMFGGGSAGVVLDELWRFNGSWTRIEKAQ